MQAYSRTGKQVLKRFKKEPKYTHHRSEGLTHRTNKGSALQSWQRAIKRLEPIHGDVD